jgi:hypothetical protein
VFEKIVSQIVLTTIEKVFCCVAEGSWKDRLDFLTPRGVKQSTLIL